MNFILRGDICFSEDKNRIRAAENAFAVCEDGICRGVFAEIPERYAGWDVTDFSGKLVIPGMTDLHIHAPQFAYRGLGMDLELLDWLDAYAFREEAKYADPGYAERAYGIFADALKKSASTRAVIFATIHRGATELLMEQLEDTGLLTCVGKVNMDRNSPDSYRESSAEASLSETERWLKETAGRFRHTAPIITPRFVPSCSPALMKGLGALSAAFGVPVQSHLSENPGEIAWVRSLEPDARFYGDAYDRFGLFGKPQKCVMAHAVYSSEEEIALMKDNGVFVAHCPASNMNVSSGIAPVRKYLDRGLNVGLGTDVAGGHTESLFTSVAEAVQNSKLYWRMCDQNAKPLSFEEAFFMATKGGGAFFGRVGAFEDGYDFDALVLDDSVLPHPQPLSLRERLERAVYLGADSKGMTAKYCQGRRIR